MNPIFPGPVRVLLMEDDPEAARRVAGLVPEKTSEGSPFGGFQFTHVTCYGDGLRKLSETSFDVILFDLGLPDAEGPESLRQMMLRDGRTPVVAMCPEGDGALSVRALEAGALDVLDGSCVSGDTLARVLFHVVKRSQAEIGGRDSERELLKVLDQTPTMMFLLDQSLQIVRCNERAAGFSGRHPGDLFGLLMGEALRCVNSKTFQRCGGNNPPCLRCGLRKALQVTFGGGGNASRVEVQLVADCSSGTGEHSLLVTTGRLVFAGDRLVLVSLEDITDCRVAERMAIEGYRFQKVLMDTIPLAIFHKSTRGEYLGCNKAFSAMTGVPEDRLLGRTLRDIGPKELVDPYAAMDAQLLANPGQAVSEGAFQFADGTVREVRIHKATITDIEDRVTGLVGAVVDMSEEKRSAVERNRLAAAVHQAVEGIVITDPDGRIRYVNPGFERLTGYSREEALGRDFLEIGDGVHDQSFYGHIRESLARGEEWKGHLRSRTKRGVFNEEEISIAAVREDLGGLLGYVCIKRDVTKEAALERQLRQAQKLEAVGTLAGGIAHDFNNILGAMMGYTELALFDLEKDHTVRGHLVEVMKGAQRARDLVKQILAFSRKGEREIQPLMVSPIVKEALKLLRASLPTTIDIQDDITSCKHLIMGDATQVHQILMNLCTNAAYAMKDHGGILGVTLDEITLDAASCEMHARLKFGTYVRLTVTDTGTGMDASTLERIFEPYFTTKPQEEGTGLGLAVVHGIVHGCGGEINVASEPGGGTRFEVLLPALVAGVEVSPKIETPASTPGGTERILIVDDEVALTDIAVKLLKHLGYRPTARNSSAEALELFKSRPDGFDLLLTDQTMPEMAGDELVRRVRAVRPGLPVVICTGFSEKITRESLEALDVRHYLLKPIVLEQLAQAVRNALDFSRGA